MNPPTPYYGLMAEFETPQAVLKATRAARREGYRVMDAYTPYPIRGLGAALDVPRTQIPFVVLAGGVVGAASGLFMQWWTMGYDYPFNAGGRPLNSWPVFIPIAFEVLILIASLSAVLGMLLLNGLPRPFHPVFNVPRFAEASQTSFFLCIEALDPHFEPERTRQFLAEQGAKEVMVVPYETP